MRGNLGVIGSNKFGGNDMTVGGPQTYADSEDMHGQMGYNAMSSGGGSGIGGMGALEKHQSATGAGPPGAMAGQHDMKNLLQASSSQPQADTDLTQHYKQ